MQTDIVKEWLRKAEDDFEFASASIIHTDHFAQVCFHFHQAAEKYLKAFILANGLEFRRIHNLLELLGTCKQKDPSSESIDEHCRYLNPFYTDTRYPVHWPTQYDKSIATEAKEAAEKIGEWVKNILSEA